MSKINGRIRNDANGKALIDFINEEEYKVSQIAVEINGEIIRKKDYDSKIISDDDVIEVVSFVGGG